MVRPNKIFLYSLIALCFAGGCLLNAQAAANDAPLTAREKMLLERIAKLEERVAAIESSAPGGRSAPVKSADGTARSEAAGTASKEAIKDASPQTTTVPVQ